MVMLHLNARNSRNGNPRRVYVLIGDHNRIHGAWDEGHSGYQAVPQEYHTLAVHAALFDTTPAEYRRLIKLEKA